MKKKLVGAAILLWFLSPVVFAGENEALIMQGATKTLFSAFEIPRNMIAYSSSAPFPLGIVTGTVVGAVKTVTGTVSGVVNIAQGAAPYAKYAALLLV